MQFKYKHREAYCLMKYSDAHGIVQETVWNSRDGVTPFVLCSQGGINMNHVDWQNDVCNPNHVPSVGDRIFVDATEKFVEQDLNNYINKWWGNPEADMSRSYESKQHAYDKLLVSWLGDGHQPYVLKVNQAWLDARPKTLSSLIEKAEAQVEKLTSEVKRVEYEHGRETMRAEVIELIESYYGPSYDFIAKVEKL